MAVGFREATDCAVDPGARRQCGRSGSGARSEREPVFKWRREFERGELTDACAALIPVTVTGASKSASDTEQAPQGSRKGAIHIELEGRATLSVESGADPSLVRLILESLRK